MSSGITVTKRAGLIHRRTNLQCGYRDLRCAYEGRVGTEDLENPPKTTCPLTCVPVRGSNRIHSKITRVVVWGEPRTSDYPKKPSGVNSGLQYKV